MILEKIWIKQWFTLTAIEYINMTKTKTKGDYA